MDGRGVARLLESRCSSTSEVKEDMVVGMTPDRDVEERSLDVMSATIATMPVWRTYRSFMED